MAKAYPHVWLGDKLVDIEDAKVAVTSSAVLYGLSVYTVFTVCIGSGGKRLAFSLDQHFKRLINSAHIIGIDTFSSEWDLSRFKTVVKELMRANDVAKDVFVRATVHVVSDIAGPRSRGLQTLLSIFVYDAEPILLPEGSRLKTSMWRRVPDYAIPARAKVNGAYVNSVLAKQDALDSGYDDCVFLDGDGHVCELSAANIFIVREGRLITPSATSDLLEGINRQVVMKLAKEELGMDVIERTIDMTELYIADEAFASGTSANIAPIIEVDKRQIGSGKPGEIAKKMQKLHSDLLHGKLTTYSTLLTEC